MPRREHKKSRNGCIECKRRHIKCDEKRPRCSHCTASERTCEFAKPIWRNITGRPARQSPSSSNTNTPSPSTTDDGGINIPRTQPHQHEPDDAPANLLHCELLHHLFTQTGPSLDPSFLHSPDFPPTMFSTPYLLNEMLAFSALHKSTQYATSSPQSAHYRHHAAQLQTHALSLFNASSISDLPVTQDTCVPLFLFANILGMHLLCDTLVHRSLHNDAHETTIAFDPFLDRFISYLRLHRGVRSITAKAWHMLRESSLKPFLQLGEAKFRPLPAPAPHPLPPPSLSPSSSSSSPPSADSTSTNPCNQLMKRIESARLGPEITSSYRQAIDALQLSFNANNHRLDDTAATASSEEEKEKEKATISGACTGTTGWPVLLGSDYLDLLALRRPEALVILAHYGVLLHGSRGVWVVGDGGQFLIESIVGYLGEEWGEWLEWPVRSLASASA